jgi:hypothetical protein
MIHLSVVKIPLCKVPARIPFLEIPANLGNVNYKTDGSYKKGFT